MCLSLGQDCSSSTAGALTANAASINAFGGTRAGVL